MAFLLGIGQKVLKMGDDVVHARWDDAASTYLETVVAVPGVSHATAIGCKVAGKLGVKSAGKAADGMWDAANTNSLAIVQDIAKTGDRYVMNSNGFSCILDLL